MHDIYPCIGVYILFGMDMAAAAQVHPNYVGHLRGVHASNQPMEVEVTNSSGTKTKTIVMASDPLAENGALYYYHSKTKMYGELEWFF